MNCVCDSPTTDNTSQSTLLVAIGGHRRKPFEMAFVNNPVQSSLARSQSETSFTTSSKAPDIKPILLDLNSLPPDCDCAYGCKVDVYVTVRHRLGCPHQRHQEFIVGTKKFDYVGKGTYLYQIDGEEPALPSQTEFKQKCADFSERCEKLLHDLSKYRDSTSLDCFSKTNYSQHLLERGRIVQVVDKFSFRQGSDQTVRRHFGNLGGVLTKSEVDLYEWGVVQNSN